MANSSRSSLLPRPTKNLSDYVGDLRNLLQLSQEEVAQYIGKHHTAIGRYESDKVTIPFEYLPFLAKLYIEQLESQGLDTRDIREALLGDVNLLIGIYYRRQATFQDWKKLCHTAEVYLSKRHKEEVPEQSELPELTLEEHEVMRLRVEERCTVYEIAYRMDVSVSYISEKLTYSESPRSLLYKLGARSIPVAEQRYIQIFGSAAAHQKSEMPNERHHLTWWRLASVLSSHSINTLTVCYCMCLPVFFIIWIASYRDCTNCVLNFYSNSYLVIPLVGSGLGFVKLFNHYWSLKNFPVPLLIFCLALLAWSIGNMNWMYNNFKYGEKVPYPTPGDWAYLTNNVLWVIGVYWLQRALGATLVRKTFMLLLFGGVLFMSLVALMWVMREGQWHPKDPMKFFFDVSFPFASGLTLALVRLWRTDASFDQLDQVMKRSVRFIFWGAVCLFFADLGFSIGTLVPEDQVLAYSNGGWQDFSFATAFYLLGLGLLVIPIQPPEQVMTVLKVWERIVHELRERIRRLLGILVNLKASQNTTPKFYFFVKRLNAFVRFAKLFTQFVMQLKLPRQFP